MEHVEHCLKLLAHIRYDRASGLLNVQLHFLDLAQILVELLNRSMASRVLE